MKISIVESDDRYQILGDGTLLGFVPDEANYPLGVELLVKHAEKKGDDTLSITVGVLDEDEFNYTVDVKLPEVMPPSSNGKAEHGKEEVEKEKKDKEEKDKEGDTANEKKDEVAGPPNARVALLIERRKRGQIAARKMSIVDVRRMSQSDRMRVLIETRRKDNG